VWNRLRYLKDPLNGKRRSRLNPPNAWVVEAVPDLRIIAQPLWNTVQQRLLGIRDSARVTKARATPFWEHRRAQQLLTDKVFCGSCGSPLAAVGADHLACGKARRMGTCKNRRGVRRGVFEGLILERSRTS
jgi:site-specific DNA recombinase